MESSNPISVGKLSERNFHLPVMQMKLLTGGFNINSDADALLTQSHSKSGTLCEQSKKVCLALVVIETCSKS
jgi:hypothetical protein